MVNNICKEQFKCLNFGLGCTEKEKNDFYLIEWSPKRYACLIYRICIFLYQLGWWIASYVYYSQNGASQTSYRFLTNWGQFVLTLYFGFALTLAIIGVAECAREKKGLPKYGGIAWIRGITWVLHSVASIIAILITILFYGLLASAASLTVAVSVHNHMINTFLVLIEIFVAAVPVRLLHFIYPMVFSICYVIATLIFHGAGDTSAVYSILDWQNNPGFAALASVIVVLVGTIIIHSLVFGFYCLRIYIAGKLSVDKRPPSVKPSVSSVDASIENIAYENTP